MGMIAVSMGRAVPSHVRDIPDMGAIGLFLPNTRVPSSVLIYCSFCELSKAALYFVRVGSLYFSLVKQFLFLLFLENISPVFPDPILY